MEIKSWQQISKEIPVVHTTKKTMILSKLGRFVWRSSPNVRKFSAKYQKALEKYPVLMQAVQVNIKWYLWIQFYYFGGSINSSENYQNKSICFSFQF